MRWQGREGSKNVEDRRGMKGPAIGGGIIMVIIVAIISLLNGGNPLQVLMQAGAQVKQQQQAAAVNGAKGGVSQEAQDELTQFVSVVLKDTEDVWNRLFPERFGEAYREPTLVLFDGSVSTRGCGSATSAVGPFYCPGDRNVYLDLSFFNDLQTKFDAPGDFACAYVIAHEVGHHIQNLVGLSMKVQEAQQSVSKVEANQLSVRLELQADFLAGVWAHHAQKMKSILDPGDLAEAINAAQQIGDDTLQRNATGRVRPDAFTHGTSQQRIKWFTYGLESGSLDDLDIFFSMDYEQL